MRVSKCVTSFYRLILAINISLCEHKSGQMLQAVKQSLTWMPETLMRGFSGLGQFFIASGVLTFVLRPKKIQMFGGQTFMFESPLNLFFTCPRLDPNDGTTARGCA